MGFVRGMLLCVVGCVSMAAAQQPAAPAAQPSATPAQPSGTSAQPSAGRRVTATTAVLFLRTSLTSSSSTPGKEVKAELRQAVALPGGITLSKGTLLMGTVVAINKRSNEKPNGAMVLQFDRALPKGMPPLPVLVRITDLQPSLGTENATTELPNSNGHMVGLASNSGGSALLSSEFNDRNPLESKYPTASSVAGVYLAPTAQGSGLMYAAGADVYLDRDIRMVCLIAAAPPDTKETQH